MLRIGIVGMGGMGWFHASRYFMLPDVQLAAIADVRPERMDAKNAVQINIENKASIPDVSRVEHYPDANHLIASADVDIVDVCLPTYLHAEYAVKALQRGRHVLCEKPMALKVADAEAMIAAAHASGQKLMIAQCIRFWPEYRFLKEVIRKGDLGDILSLSMYRIGSKPSGWGWENWFMDPARSGGSLYDLHIHDVDFVNYLLGMPDQAYASARRPEPGSGLEVIHATFGYRGGPQVAIHAGWSTAIIPFLYGYEAWFQKGFVRLDPTKTPALAVYDDTERMNEQPAAYTPGDAYFNEIEYFVNCIKNNEDLSECPPESARDSLVLIARERAMIDREEE